VFEDCPSSLRVVRNAADDSAHFAFGVLFAAADARFGVHVDGAYGFERGGYLEIQVRESSAPLVFGVLMSDSLSYYVRHPPTFALCGDPDGLSSLYGTTPNDTLVISTLDDRDVYTPFYLTCGIADSYPVGVNYFFLNPDGFLDYSSTS
jgi:hypothetical protein